MTDHDRIKLLFGPHAAPPRKRGDRACCLCRDCDVVVTSWTDAPIPWPRYRWREDDVALLGTLPDCELARRLGRSVQSVTQKRIKLGLANSFDGRRRTMS
jgi:hypothetical protein